MTASPWSHAGGVVMRTVNGNREYLLVEASDDPGIWVLPKGRIERGETPEQAAVREVNEEAGVRAAIVAQVGDNEYVAKGRTVRTVFYLMTFEGNVERTEPRALAWHRYEAAVALLHFENTRRILTQAHTLEERTKL
jgi:8-oxo-dGTP pyrophosphatase MutT (NUDIX family)